MHPGELVGGHAPVERRTLPARDRDDLHQPAAIEVGDRLGTDARCPGTVRCGEVLDGREQLTHAGSAVPSKPAGAVWDRNRRRAVSLYRRPGEQVLHARDRGPGPSGGLLQVSRPGARFGERLRGSSRARPRRLAGAVRAGTQPRRRPSASSASGAAP